MKNGARGFATYRFAGVRFALRGEMDETHRGRELAEAKESHSGDLADAVQLVFTVTRVYISMLR